MELKDARVRELMYAEREAILDKVSTSFFAWVPFNVTEYT